MNERDSRTVAITSEQRVATVHDGAVAIVGMAGRFPGADGVTALWEVLSHGRETVCQAPADRTWMHDLYAPNPGGPGWIPTDRGGFLSGVDEFDAAFFDMTPREASRADPQLRLLLETAHNAFEDAGMTADQRRGTTAGVFVGNISDDYWLRQLNGLEDLDFYAEVGAHCRSALSGRLAYAFDLRGPSLTVDTACASSLAAVHLACQSLRAGECQVALAGAANVILTPHSYLTFSSAGALSSRGKSSFASAAADGFVRAEAVAVIVLKPLSAALADGDRIRAVLLGSAISSNGFTGNGLAAPSVDGQVATLTAAYDRAGVDPRTVAYVEAHGTGTPAGDRIELAALAEVMGPRPDKAELCLIGSVKTNLGHTEATAGLVGLIKAVLCLERGVVPADPHAGPPADASGGEHVLRLPSSTVVLPEAAVAGVSSFGVTGTNAHVVVGSAPSATPVPAGPGPYVLPVSARSPGALRELARRYADLLEADNAGQVCTAAAQRRDHYEHRLAVTGASFAELADGLRDFASGRARDSAAYGCGPRPRVVFVYPGQGSQWHGMGRALLGASRPFREAMEACEEVIQTHGGWSLLDALQGEDGDWLTRTSAVQPALWAMSVALTEVWRAWGLAPDAVVGQSQGEIAAAYCAGALSLEQAGLLSCRRARLVEDLAPVGAMAWIGTSPGDLPGLLRDLGATATEAVRESPVSGVVSGAADQIERIVNGCEGRDIPAVRLPVSYAAHSPHIDPVQAPLMAELDGWAPGETSIPFWSTVTGGLLNGAALDAPYWWRNLREPVLLHPVVTALAAGPAPALFLQISPHPVLGSALRRNLGGSSAMVAGTLHRDVPDPQALLRSLGEVYAAGCAVDWQQVHGRRAPITDLPAYPWQRTRHWHQPQDCPWPPIGGTERPQHVAAPVEDEAPGPGGNSSGSGLPSDKRPRSGAGTPPASAPPHPMLGEPVGEDPDRREWQGPLLTEATRFLTDHQVAGVAVMPGAGCLELAYAAAGHLPGDLSWTVTGLEFRETLLLDDDTARLRVRGERQGRNWRLDVSSRPGQDGTWTEHSRATLRPCEPDTPQAVPLAELRRRCPDEQPGDRFYRDRADNGNTWQGAFRGIGRLWFGAGEILAQIEPNHDSGYYLHPATADACLQTAVPLLPGGGRGVLLRAIATARLHRPAGSGPVWCHARLRTDAPPTVDLTVTDDTGAVVAELAGVTAEPLAPATGLQEEGAMTATATTATAPWLHKLSWVEVPDTPVPADHGRWLLLPGGSGLEGPLRDALGAAGATVVTVRHGRRYAPEGPDRYRIVPGVESDLTQVVNDALRHGPLHGVIALHPLTLDDCAHSTPLELHDAVTDLCGQTASLYRALADAGPILPDCLVLITRGAQAPDGSTPILPWQRALWAFTRAIGREHTAFCTALVDLPPEPDAGDAEAITQAVLSRGPETQLVLRAGKHLAPRLRPGAPVAAAPRVSAQRAPEPGDARQKQQVQRTEQTPEPGDPTRIELHVTHVGHPVSWAGGVYDCVGTVARPGAAGLLAGDRVLALAHGTASGRVLADPNLVTRIPSRLVNAEAAALPVAYSTAYHALVELARLRPEEIVLLHAAADAIGMAALAVARWLGATVYATAATEAGRDMLRQLGAARVADCACFAEEFRDTGVDVIVNTLTGTAAEQSLALLNTLGRYVDVTPGGTLPPAAFTRGRCYLPVGLADLYQHAPRRLGSVLGTVVDLIDRGQLPLPAFRVVPQGASPNGHLGTLVHPVRDPAPRPAETAHGPVRADATYLITGGLGGIGRELAHWLISQGARHLLLTGRTPPRAGDPRVTELERLDGHAQVTYAAIDAADEAALADLLRERELHGLPDVAGVVHAAGVLDPAPARDLSDQELALNLSPKVAGGWALHRLFKRRPLDFFVLFSSTASVLSGLTVSYHLAPYAAGNAFLDALADHRRAAGLPATVVNWGYWTDTGLAARLSRDSGHDVRPTGMGAIRTQDAPELFAAVLRTEGQMICLPADWAQYTTAYPDDARDLLLADLTSTADPPAAPAPLPSPRPSAITSRPAPPPSDASRPSAASQAPAPPPRPTPADDDMEDCLVQQLARVLGCDPDDIDRSKAMNRHGMDSLMAVELRTRLRREREVDVPVKELLSSESLRSVAARLTSTRQSS
ncbi:type I polyketide synthase [Streptomyces albicerus]|uniref:type I polyketide synthase n=1 Tax=Streptomyces albicerus TaxID=2569859 RepID=UPI00124B0092|nr:type I polyketide synthase [Streptomyces albicerus]